MKAIKMAKGKGRNVYRVALVPAELYGKILPERFEVFVEKEHYKLGNYRKAWFRVGAGRNPKELAAGLDLAAAEKLFRKYEAPAAPPAAA